MAWARGFRDIKIEAFWANGSYRDKYYPRHADWPGTAITLAVNDANLLARACVWKEFAARWDCTSLY